MSITVGEIAALRHLHAEVLAGRNGLDKPITWAHVIDRTPEPWLWLDRGDLLITTGVSMPSEARGQRVFITRLHEAGMSGIVTAPEAPPWRRETTRTADRLGFPILSASEQASFAEYVRTVANANERAEGELLSSTLRVYGELRLAIEGERTSAELVGDLGDLIGSDLFVVDPLRGESVLPGCPELDATWCHALAEEIADRGEHLPLMMRLDVDDRLGMAVPIPSRREACLLAVPRSEQTPKLAILQHVGAACTFELARIDAELERRRRIGATVLSDAIEGQTDAQVLSAHLLERELTGRLVCLVLDSDADELDRLQRGWAVSDIPHLISQFGGRHIVLTNADSPALVELQQRAEQDGYRVGLSSYFTGSTGILDAARQARWALETIAPDSAGMAVYGESQDAFLPRTMSECEHAVHRVLGPLIAYDEANETNLVWTLKAYLECDRSPQKAAKELFVHKQTVTYRIKRIEELTSRSMRSTSDVSEMWCALRALALISVGEGGRGEAGRGRWTRP